MPSNYFGKRVEIPNRIWKGEGFEKIRKDIAKQRKVCNNFSNLIINNIIINFYIKFETCNIFQPFHRISHTSKATKAKQEKSGQHKLAPTGYSNLVAQIVSIKKPILHLEKKNATYFSYYLNLKGNFMALCKYAG